MATFGDFPPDNGDNKPRNTADDTQWERTVLRDLAFAAIKEQRAKRRWGYVFKFLILLYLVGFMVLAYSPGKLATVADPHTAMVDIQGIIASDAEANADAMITGIREAFESETAKGLILRLNTPGGSPVQAGLINDEIQRLRAGRPDFPVYAVVQDVCASGGYYIAVAADEIYADKASIVGSIGVRMDSFGLTGLIDKIGVERRSLTAGEHKAFLDPFLPMEQEDIEHAQQMLDTIHQQFINVVKAGRGDKLANNDDLFSGLFWSGEQAIDLGLIDGFAGTGKVARELIGAEEVIDYTPRPNYLDQFAGKLGASIANLMTEKANWSLQ
ncbi:S49 family peptidase [Methylophaga sp.]|jgi:protease-4|uniref:S49 family peptidase n=1 Tax=Methylophaga sp. TaxID=2024840 RepID=UPI0013FFA4B8|nr:S49 family peptidase [Methylophaga sp.]MTI63194.1 S49 family peptidase [Methylophaga sp.]